MKLTKLSITDVNSRQTGLKSTDILFKSNFVAIIGKNGSGKTRLLNLIQNSVIRDAKELNKKGDLIEIPKPVQNMGNDIEFRERIGNLITLIKPDDIKKLPIQNNNKINSAATFERILNLENESFETNEYKIINESSISFFMELSTRIIIEQIKYANKTSGNFKNTKVYQNFKSLANKFEALIEKTLEFELDNNNISMQPDGSASGLRGIWLLNGRKFDYNELSDGERILLSYILILFLQENYNYSKTKNSIILIDEPESHLHPEAQIKLITGLKDLIGTNGQLIVATHSLSIMSLFNYDQIYLMKDNQIYPPNSSRPEEALNELVGIQNRITYLSNLFHGISSWSFAHFMLNNFKEPEVISNSNKNDPQFKSFINILKSNISFLDFGCGQGRLIKLINENNLVERFNKIDVFEPDPKFQEELKTIPNIKNVYTELNKLNSEYDLILLSNVLHEISPREIINTIKKLNSILKKNGVFVIIEDLVLRKGEMPNKNGYLVFNPDELKLLFNLNKLPILIESKEEKYKNRLMCSVISRSNIGVLNNSNLNKAVTRLKERSLKNAVNLRNGDNCEEGRNYAFYLQQYMNAELTLKELKSNTMPNKVHISERG